MGRVNICQLLWAVDVLILEREGKRSTRRKILVAQERSTVDTQLAHERTNTRLGSSGERHNILQGQIIKVTYSAHSVF